MIGEDGFRIGVGIILINDTDKVLWARRIGKRAWQFPQGGIQSGEKPEEALHRELFEELGLSASDVSILGHTRAWLYYTLPVHLRRNYLKPLCIGQKQRWFLLRLVNKAAVIRLDRTKCPEFDQWCWVDYWYPVDQVVSFKQNVYRLALKELSQYLAKPSEPAKHSNLT